MKNFFVILILASVCCISQAQLVGTSTKSESKSQNSEGYIQGGMLNLEGGFVDAEISYGYRFSRTLYVGGGISGNMGIGNLGVFPDDAGWLVGPKVELRRYIPQSILFWGVELGYGFVIDYCYWEEEKDHYCYDYYDYKGGVNYGIKMGIAKKKNWSFSFGLNIQNWSCAEECWTYKYYDTDGNIYQSDCSYQRGHHHAFVPKLNVCYSIPTTTISRAITQAFSATY